MCDQEKALAAGVALLERAINYALGSLRVVTPAALCRPTPCADWNLQHLLDHMTDSLRTLNAAASGHIPPAAPQKPYFPPPTPRPPIPPTPAPKTLTTPGSGGGATSRSSVRESAASAPGGEEGGASWCSGPGESATTASGKAGSVSSRSGIREPAAFATGEGDSASLRFSALGRPMQGGGANPALLLRDRAAELLGVWAATVTRPGMVSIDDRRLTSPMVAAAGAIEIAVHGWDVARACGEHHPIPALMAEELLDLAHLFVTRADRPHRFAPPRPLPPHASAQDHLLAYLGRDPNWSTAL
ncbi:maleylpyruvate isomerase N-terminal domain-containing protein [Nonomuraea sp. NPDC050153]|uniref:maleylpyruvate isomerase N-terminal domain-containing protein n=1 Tax=Nonomuraea sp. NPDC050153 TaxID=3364359 RepID=UPI0037A57D83